jgi:hypothetical protein
VTHFEALAKAVEDETGKRPRRVVKIDAETSIEGLTLSGEFMDDDADEDVSG